MVLLNWGWSRLVNKLSLLRSMNLFALQARISKWSKSIEQLHSSRWSDTAYCLTHLRRFPVKLEIPMCSAALVKKWWYVSGMYVRVGMLLWNIETDKRCIVVELYQFLNIYYWLVRIFNSSDDALLVRAKRQKF